MSAWNLLNDSAEWTPGQVRSGQAGQSGSRQAGSRRAGGKEDTSGSGGGLDWTGARQKASSARGCTGGLPMWPQAFGSSSSWKNTGQGDVAQQPAWVAPASPGSPGYGVAKLSIAVTLHSPRGEERERRTAHAPTPQERRALPEKPLLLASLGRTDGCAQAECERGRREGRSVGRARYLFSPPSELCVHFAAGLSSCCNVAVTIMLHYSTSPSARRWRRAPDSQHWPKEGPTGPATWLRRSKVAHVGFCLLPAGFSPRTCSLQTEALSLPPIG
jgi:hypothetical protein